MILKTARVFTSSGQRQQERMTQQISGRMYVTPKRSHENLTLILFYGLARRDFTGALADTFWRMKKCFQMLYMLAYDGLNHRELSFSI